MSTMLTTTQVIETYDITRKQLQKALADGRLKPDKRAEGKKPHWFKPETVDSFLAKYGEQLRKNRKHGNRPNRGNSMSATSQSIGAHTPPRGNGTPGIATTPEGLLQDVIAGGKVVTRDPAYWKTHYQLPDGIRISPREAEILSALFTHEYMSQQTLNTKLERANVKWDVKKQIYTTLNALRQKGLIRSDNVSDPEHPKTNKLKHIRCRERILIPTGSPNQRRTGAALKLPKGAKSTPGARLALDLANVRATLETALEGIDDVIQKLSEVDTVTREVAESAAQLQERLSGLGQ